MPVQTITRTVRFFKVRVVQADDTVVSGRDREVFPLVHARDRKSTRLNSSHP